MNPKQNPPDLGYDIMIKYRGAWRRGWYSATTDHWYVYHAQHPKAPLKAKVCDPERVAGWKAVES